ncbi:MAG: hypothetical protein R2838_23670 [Caldilineaceae bacterium]
MPSALWTTSAAFSTAPSCCWPSVHTAEELAVQITLDLLRTEWVGETATSVLCSTRPTRSSACALHNLRDALTIFSVPMEVLALRRRLRACTSSWRCADDTMIPARGKLIGSYVNSVLIGATRIAQRL